MEKFSNAEQGLKGPQIANEGLSKGEEVAPKVPTKASQVPVVAETHPAKQQSVQAAKTPVITQVSNEGLSKVEEGSYKVPAKATHAPAVAETHPAQQQVSVQAAKVADMNQPFADLKLPVFTEMAKLIHMRKQLDDRMMRGLPIKDLPIFQDFNRDIDVLFGSNDMGLAVEIHKKQVALHEAQTIANQKLNQE